MIKDRKRFIMTMLVALIAVLAVAVAASAETPTGELENASADPLDSTPLTTAGIVTESELSSASVVSASPPTASFTYAPASPVIGEPVTFDAASSTCPDGPCTYAWSDDGSSTRPIPPLWPLGSGRTLQFTFWGVGTKYVRLVVTDALGQTATTEQNVKVGASEPPPPSAPSEVAPPTVSGAAMVGQTLTASTGTWTGSPTSYAYQWQDCNAAGGGCADVAGASSSTYRPGSGDVGDTVRVVVTASNAGGATPATSASVGPVSAPPPTASFTYAPASPVAGEPVTFDAASSTCPDGPCTYAWSDDGSSTRPIPPLWPLGSGRTLQFTFAGVGTKYVRLVVTDASGQTATTEQNVEVGASEPPPPPPPPSGSGSLQTNCFRAPSACGYPDPTNSGVPAGTPLEARSGDIVVSAEGTTIKDVNLNGSIEVRASNTTIEDDEITVNGTQRGCSSPCGGNGIHIFPGIGGVVVKHVTCHGGAQSGENVTTFCFRNEGQPANRYEHNQIYYTAACFWGAGVYEDNYCLDNGDIPNAHYDGIYYGGGSTSIAMNHNTILQPHEQTAAIFFSHDESDPRNIAITNNLLAGGGYTIYGGGSGQNGFTVLGPVTVTGNRFARCLTKSVYDVEGGHHVCEGGYDSHGYYPNGGSYGLYAYFNEAVTTFSGNYWDDNLEAAP